MTGLGGSPHPTGRMPLGPGDPLPDLPLLAAGGERASLADFRGEASVLIFLRHLG